MIESVKKEGTTFTEAPLKFEPGTPPISEVIGLNAAIEYIQSIGLKKIREHELNLAEITRSELKKNPLIRIIGNAKNRAATISFIMEGIHPHDIGTILDNENIAVRVGHHCTQPTMTRFKVPATARVTFGIYNEENDINRLIKGLNEAKDLFGIWT